MILNLSLKIALVTLLLIGAEKQLITYYSSVPTKNAIDNVESVIPAKPQTVKTNEVIQIAEEHSISSNIIMTWNSSDNKISSHSFTPKEFELLQRLARSLPSDGFNKLMEQAKNMSTPDFITYVKDKEQLILSSTQVAKLN